MTSLNNLFSSLFDRSAHRGIHPPKNKITSGSPIEKAPLPETVILPVIQHVGAPARVVVDIGDRVRTGEKIAELGGRVSATVHATVSGTIEAITTITNPMTSKPCDAVVIASDGKDEWVPQSRPRDPDSLSKDEIIDLIREGGIVGLGGASYPTHVKLVSSQATKIEVILANGCECESYVTADHRLMLENAADILKGLGLVMRVLDCDKAIVGIEDNKSDAAEIMKAHISGMKLPGEVSVKLLKTRYPLGA